jgi:SNF2 family DNA or RNA helicase
MHQTNGKIKKILLVVPVNTVVNWQNEFDKWTRGMEQKIVIHNTADGSSKGHRERLVKKWAASGGVFLSSDGLYRNLMKIQEVAKELENPDVIILDESHTMLKNKDNQLFKQLANVKTPRRLCLTGTPFQVCQFYLCMTIYSTTRKSC